MDNYDHSVCGELRINVHEIYVIFLFFYKLEAFPPLGTSSAH